MKIQNIEEYPLTPNEAIRKMESETSSSPVYAYPTIEIGEKVKLHSLHLSGNEELENRILTVNKLYIKDLGDMTVYIVKFEETNDAPYLAHHFYTITEEET